MEKIPRWGGESGGIQPKANTWENVLCDTYTIRDKRERKLSSERRHTQRMRARIVKRLVAKSPQHAVMVIAETRETGDKAPRIKGAPSVDEASGSHTLKYCDFSRTRSKTKIAAKDVPSSHETTIPVSPLTHTTVRRSQPQYTAVPAIATLARKAKAHASLCDRSTPPPPCSYDPRLHLTLSRTPF